MSQALLTSHDVAMNMDSTDKLTVSEFLGVFGCTGTRVATDELGWCGRVPHARDVSGRALQRQV